MSDTYLEYPSWLSQHPQKIQCSLIKIKTNLKLTDFEIREQHIFFVRWLNQLAHNLFQGWKFHWNQWESVNIKTFQDYQQTGVRLLQIVFISKDYTHYLTIIRDYLRLLFCKNPNDYFRLLHYLRKDDYFTYCTTIISIIFFSIYYCDYCDYLTIIWIIFIASYYFDYCIWDILLRLFFPVTIMHIMHIILLLFEFFLTIITPISFQYYYTLFFSRTHYLHYCIYSVKNNWYNTYN